MNLFNRIDRIERKIKMDNDLFPEMPDFENYTEEQLDKYINDRTEEEHKEFAIHSYQDALKVYSRHLSEKLMTQEEFDLYMEKEKDYWSKKEGELN